MRPVGGLRVLEIVNGIDSTECDGSVHDLADDAHVKQRRSLACRPRNRKRRARQEPPSPSGRTTLTTVRHFDTPSA